MFNRRPICSHTHANDLCLDAFFNRVVSIHAAVAVRSGRVIKFHFLLLRDGLLGDNLSKALEAGCL